VHENKRCRLDDENEESSATTTINAEPEITVESPTAPGSTNNKRSRICDNTEESSAGVRTDHEPITIESPGPTPTRSQEDVMIVGDVQVASPEVIDLERLPTIRQGNCSWYRQWRVLTILKPGKPTTCLIVGPLCKGRIWLNLCKLLSGSLCDTYVTHVNSSSQLLWHTGSMCSDCSKDFWICNQACIIFLVLLLKEGVEKQYTKISVNF